MLREDLVFTQKHFESKKDAILFLAEPLKEKGHVYETFANTVVEREEKYPTGLYLGKINVAIPHTDTKHVKQSGVAILTLDKPLMFNKMDDPSQTIPVLIVFLLAVSEPNEYVQFLSKLAENFSKEETLKRIYKETDSAKVIMTLKGKSSESKVAFVVKEVFVEEVGRRGYLL
jgi:PTS system galactitol-specific IIA component